MLRDLFRAAAQSAVMAAPNFIAAEWAQSGTLFERTGPWLGEVVTQAWEPDPADIERALTAAADAAPAIARLSPAHRAAVLDRAAEIAVGYRDELALLIARELGKPISDGGKEIDRLADTFRICAHEARRIGGDVLPVAGWENGVGNTALTYRAPLGVALVITPFNAPANLLAHKLGASFAAGNTTLVKSPPQAPAVSAAVVAVLLEAGMPAEAVQILHGGGELGARLCAAEPVAVISFTGSAATGNAVARAAGAKRLVLELGGNAATIVCDDADVEAAARICARTGYSNSGQSCISVQRIYTHASVLEEFVGVLTKEVGKLNVGDPTQPGVDIGSMVDEAAAGRVQSWIQAAVEDGADLVCGGQREGATLQPSIVVNPRRDATLVTNEAFGAVVVVLPFQDFDDVLAECNRSRFGLQAGIFTQRMDRTLQAWRELQVGAVIVNGSSNYRLDHVPFGGVKDSGFGRETPASMIEDYTQVKTLIVRGVSIWGDQ